MACDCEHIKGIVIDHSELDSGVYIRTKSETPDPSVTTSATAYARFQKELRDYLRSILAEAIDVDLDQFRTGQAAQAEMIRLIAQHNIPVPDYVRSFLARQAYAGVEMGMSRVPVAQQVATLPDLVNQQVDETVVRLQAQARQSLKTGLRSLFGDGLERGETIRELSGRVQEWAKENGDIDRQVKWRATRVARTETARSLHEGQVSAWKEAGITRMKWQIAPNPCEFCRSMSQKPHPIDEPFYNVGDRLTTSKGKILNFDYAAVKSPPLHPNCRCTLLPILTNR
jgi:hypothetical protein